jgi:hypothetical protein
MNLSNFRHGRPVCRPPKNTRSQWRGTPRHAEDSALSWVRIVGGTRRPNDIRCSWVAGTSPAMTSSVYDSGENEFALVAPPDQAGSQAGGVIATDVEIVDYH